LLPGDAATINGNAVGVDQDGLLQLGATLARPGSYLVEAGGLRRRIEMIEPQARNTAPLAQLGETSVGLPAGRWTLIGASPGEVADSVCRSPVGSVAFCAFPPVWAIEVGAGPGATARCLRATVPEPNPIQLASGRRARRRLGAWASVIYNAAIRHPRLLSLRGDDASPAVQEGWEAFRLAARQVKRSLRGTRR
jgi:hypothetical protein